MSAPKPFRPSQARGLFPQGAEGDFLSPICMPGFDLMLGEELAIVVVTTVEDQRVGIPMAVPALSELHALISEALRKLQTSENGPVQ